MLRTHLDSFQQARQRIAADGRFSHPWVCKAGLWPDSNPKAAVLKLFKQHWSPDPHDCGIFFSVWIDDSAILAGGLHYNLHALKLRQLDGYRLESRKFASAFRNVFVPISAAWPDVDVGFGPQTLFQGFAKCPQNRVEETTFDLATKFAPLANAIDKLLSKATRSA